MPQSYFLPITVLYLFTTPHLIGIREAIYYWATLTFVLQYYTVPGNFGFCQSYFSFNIFSEETSLFQFFQLFRASAQRTLFSKTPSTSAPTISTTSTSIASISFCCLSTSIEGTKFQISRIVKISRFARHDTSYKL